MNTKREKSYISLCQPRTHYQMNNNLQIHKEFFFIPMRSGIRINPKSSRNVQREPRWVSYSPCSQLHSQSLPQGSCLIICSIQITLELKRGPSKTGFSATGFSFISLVGLRLKQKYKYVHGHRGRNALHVYYYTIYSLNVYLLSCAPLRLMLEVVKVATQPANRDVTSEKWPP